jgi:hypothetical protein
MKSEKATYTGFEFEHDGYPALAIINSNLADPAIKRQYPFSVFIGVVPDSYNDYGHPEAAEYDYLNEIERSIIDYLEEQTNTVHVGHTTMYRMREIIFYTKDRDAVENFLEHFLKAVERENHFDIEADEDWENVSAFYDLL